MSSVLSNIRKEELSLYHYIKDRLLIDYYVEYSEEIPLTFNDELSSYTNDANPATNTYVYELNMDLDVAPYDNGRGWLYFDTMSGTDLCNPYIVVPGTNVAGTSVLGTPEQSNRVKVYDSNLDLISTDQYMIDYVDCRIVTSGTCNPYYVSYYWHYVSLLDEWEEAATVRPPIVVVDFKPKVKTGYQLGGGKMVVREVDLHIFASNSIEKNELIETLYNGFYNKSMPVYEFNTGSILDYDGTWYGRKNNVNKLTSLFDRTRSTFVSGNAYFLDVTVKDIRADVAHSSESIFLSKINKYRSVVKMKMVYYT